MKKINLPKFLTYITITFFQFALNAAWCQDDVNTISSIFSTYNQSILKEKLFVNTDKNFYVTGEILWLKLYDVDASTHKPLDVSKVAYVEIFDSSHKHLLQAKIALHNAEGNGSFYLPPTLTSGSYKLRAYTNWMKNFGAETYFEKNITIVNVQRRLNIPASQPANKFDIQFFPEGGNLVNNLKSVIAFKATDQYGKGINFNGFLLDNSDTAFAFKPQHDGMGKFLFTPSPNHIYRALIKTDSGYSEIINLPTAYNSGYVMRLSDEGDKISVSIQSDILSQQPLYIFVHTREIINVVEKGSMENGKTVFSISKSMLGDGISHITAFNDQRQPVCERLYFKRSSRLLNISLNTDQQEYAKRKKVQVQVHFNKNEMQDDTASLSMAVIRLDSLQSQPDININTYLLLTSDLKGYIENPSYYFLNNNSETYAALDNVMLTNGWRRFKWEDILKNKVQYFNYIPEYNGPVISANVINTITGNPAPGVETYISAPGFQNAFNTSFSDSTGKIKFELKDFYGSSEIILQPNTIRDSIYKINISDPFSEEFSGTAYPLFNFKNEKINALREQSISTQVQNIYAGKNLKHFYTPVTDTTVFYVTPDAKYNLDNYTRFTTIEEVLREYVTLVDVRKRDGEFHFILYDFANNNTLKADPLIMLDGVPVFDQNNFMAISPLKLSTLEVVNYRYFLGGSVFNGILNWSSYKGDMADYDLGPHAVIIDYSGLQQEREFYSPVYNNEAQTSNHLPDFRNVLLWSPDIKIPAGANKEIQFFTSDLPGRYIIYIQGISRSGVTGSASAIFSVSPPE